MWVRGLKLEYWLYTCRLSVSHPMWVRGLKLTYVADFDEVEMSHPMWVRGLKLQIHTSKRGRRHVAPYVGAWIETNSKELAQYQHASHPMWVRGLKLTEMRCIKHEEK